MVIRRNLPRKVGNPGAPSSSTSKWRAGKERRKAHPSCHFTRSGVACVNSNNSNTPTAIKPFSITVQLSVFSAPQEQFFASNAIHNASRAEGRSAAI